jgi:alpha-glucosidase
MSTPMLLSLGICGFSLIGDDIGGFAGSPSADLLTRWIEVGAFNPIFRDHTAKDTADQEVWVHGPQHEAIRRRYIELRYQLLPYIYTGVEEASRTGIPLMRPIFLEYPQVPGVDGNDHDFLFGRDLLVAPVVTEKLDPEVVHLPPGDWYDFWSSKKFASSDRIVLRPRLEELPLYVRAGAIVPMQPVVQSTSEVPVGPLKLRVYPGDDCRGSLYMDDGHTFAYQKNQFLKIDYTCQVSSGSVTLSSKVENSAYQPWWHDVEVTVYGAMATAKEARLGNQVISDLRYDGQSHAITFTVPNAVRDWSLVLNY